MHIFQLNQAQFVICTFYSAGSLVPSQTQASISMSPFLKKVEKILTPKRDALENTPELDILVAKGNSLHVLLLILLFFYAFAFTIINYVQGNTLDMLLTAIPLPVVIFEYIIYKRGYPILSKVLNMFHVTTIVGLLSMIHSPSNGVLAFYIPILVGTQLTFFGKERIYAHVLTVYILLALIFFLTIDFQFKPSLTGSKLRIDLFVNLFGAALATTFEILFILSVSNRIQEDLFEKSAQLNIRNKELTAALGENQKQTNLISEQLKIIQESQEDLAKLSMIATKAKSGVIITDAWGRVEWINEAFSKITQFELSEVKGKKPKEFLQPEGVEHPGFDLLRNRLKNQEFVEVVVPNKKKDGSIYMNQLEINPVFNEKNELINFVSLQRDITEELNRRDEVERTNRRFGLIIDQASIGMWVWMPATNEVIWNDVLINQYGAKRSEIEHNLYQFWQDSIYTEDRERNANNSIRLVNGEADLIKDLYRIIRKDTGEVRFVQTVTIAERNKNGELKQLLGISQDVTNEKQLQLSLENKNAELIRINSELDSFVYSVSHDLRSPLLSIKGLLALVFDTPNIEPQVENYLRMAEKSIRRLDDIIKEILEYSRNTRLEVKEEPVDFRLLVEEIYDDTRFIVEKDFCFHLKLEEPVIFISDRSRMQTVMRNLIGNAVKYRRRQAEPSYVECRILRKDGTIVIEVADNGEGISDKNLARIFDMFFRGSSTGSGTGLGLYISKQIVEKLNGTISIESKYAQGSTFRVTIPDKKRNA